ncbi:hypothetical protein D3OALGB2SA_2523 [Olavius algarvensis associated proteobacterium Delta 3]|nr:hypothetical protein D3OALGB2SA_2523 [Olavius algarvensis associated proteobacterium Delta 3]
MDFLTAGGEEKKIKELSGDLTSLLKKVSAAHRLRRFAGRRRRWAAETRRLRAVAPGHRRQNLVKKR